jgi:hypothetical protein
MFFFLFSTFCFKFFFQKEKVKKIYEKKMKNQQNIPRFSFLLFLKKKGEEKILNFNFICMDCFKKQFIQIKLKK